MSQRRVFIIALIALMASFCVALPTTDLVVPEAKDAGTSGAEFVQSTLKSVDPCEYDNRVSCRCDGLSLRPASSSECILSVDPEWNEHLLWALEDCGSAEFRAGVMAPSPPQPWRRDWNPLKMCDGYRSECGTTRKLNNCGHYDVYVVVTNAPTEAPTDAPTEAPTDAPDMCECTGNGNEYDCTQTGKGHCQATHNCINSGDGGVEYGDWSNICYDKPDMCECTGNGNEYECTQTGKGYCQATHNCINSGDGGVDYGDWSNICYDAPDMCECTGNGNEYECTQTGKAHCQATHNCINSGDGGVEYGDWSNICYD